MRKSVVSGLNIVLLSGCTLLLALIAVFSLQWRYAHDSPLMLYVAFLIDRFHAVPYRDVFDMNLPGSYFLFYLIGHSTGYSDVGFRIVDLLYLGGILTTTWFLLRGFGKLVAWAAMVLFGLLYFSFGPWMSLQREYLLILPMSLALLFATGVPGWRAPVRAVLVGLLFGICAIIKPHAIIAYPLALGYLATAETVWGRRITRLALPSLAAFLLPIGSAVLYLAHAGALPALADIATGYWPLYGSLTGQHRTIAGASRCWYLLRGFANVGGHQLLLLPALAGVLMARYDSTLPPERRRQVWLLAGVTACYGIYPVFSGQFWDYHWLLFLYWLSVLIALLFVTRPAQAPLQAALPLVIFLCTLGFGLNLPSDFLLQVQGKALPPPKEGRVDAIAGYLRTHLRPGDRVQPLDWTGGAIHAMLLARARLATPFMYDFHFYHHVSQGYTQELRRRFIHDLTAAPPRFIVQITCPDKPWPSGTDTTRDFPALSTFIATRYTVVASGNGYVIYERNDGK